MVDRVVVARSVVWRRTHRESRCSKRPDRRARYAKSALVLRNGAYLGRALASVAALTSVELAVIGGGIGLGWGDVFHEAVRREFSERSRLSFTKDFVIVPAALGDRSGLVGAAALAWSGIGAVLGD